MFKSLGNLLVNPNVGLLFIAMHEQAAAPARQRHGPRVARRPAAGAHRRRAADRARDRRSAIFPNCPRYIPKLQLVEPSVYVPQPGAGARRARLERLRRLQGRRASAPTDIQGLRHQDD